MSDDIVNMLTGNWGWRSDMAQPSPYDSRGQQPQAQSFRPRTILDNVPPMVADGLSAAGVSGPVAGDYANRMKGLAHAVPPLDLLNLASGIGNEAHQGRYGNAAGMSVVSALLGLYARGLMPGNRDAGIAQVMGNPRPNESSGIAGGAAITNALMNLPATQRAKDVGSRHNMYGESFRGLPEAAQNRIASRHRDIEAGMVANTNDRRNFNRLFQIVE